MTIIFPSPIFGPIHSRRLGVSLGINLLPDDGKVCSFDCIYCECGFNAEHRTKKLLPTREEVRTALEEKLKDMQANGPAPDVLTFAGNGEPTAHPHFPEIIEDTLALRDHYFPNAKVSVLSNSTFIDRPAVFDALNKIDNNILKLDTVDEEYIHLLDRPNGKYSVKKIIERMKEFKGNCIVQTMFLRGMYDGRRVDNTTEAEVSTWLELIREVAVEPQIDEATYKDAKPGELVEAIVKALKEAYARRAKAVADTVRPVMERIYEDRKDQLDSNIYFPLTDGHLGYNVPVNLRKCQSSDGAEIYKVFSKVVMFTTIDDAWREHLREMDDLRQSVQNATYEQKDPLLIYKFESFGLFSKMIIKVNRDVLAILNKAYIPVRDQNAEAVQRQQQERAKVDVNKLQASRMQAAAQAGQEERQKPMPLHAEKKAGRNDPCPCGSGKKYKNCHGKGL